MVTNKKRILSIDGGGIKGAFPASFLAAIEECTGENISQYFDLIVGTSTGGIIALGLGMGLTANEVLSFYATYGPRIFPLDAFQNLGMIPQRIFKSKYNHATLKDALEELFVGKTLGDSRCRLVIPSFNVETGEVHVFKTRHHERFVRDHKVSIVDVALATSSAPTFFPTHRLNEQVPLVDGGVWANNPTSIAIAEALGVLNWDKGSLHVLSLGCTQIPYSANWARNKALGLLYWGLNSPTLFMTAQSSASHGIATTIIGHDRVRRINPVTPANRYGLDKVKEFNALCGLGQTEARTQWPFLKDMFFQEIADPFTPVP